MKTIRAKLLLLLLAVVVLPFVPIVWLVNDLVHHSYNVGVNPQVAAALESGVGYSRELYQQYKQQLATQLSALKIDPASPKIPENSSPWRFTSVQIFDENLVQRSAVLRDSAAIPAIDASHFAQLRESESPQLMFTDREANAFIAMEKRGRQFVALTAALDESFLEKSGQSLQIYQLYRTLSLSPAFIPTRFLLAFLLLSAVIIAGTVGVAYWLSRRISEPIADLVKGTQEIGRGNLDYQIPQRSTDELGELVQYFNRMTGELKDYQQRTIYLEKMAAWQEIARRLAHEIKNPLTPIQLTIQEMVDQYDGSDPEYAQLLRECHGIIGEEIENLRRLVREFSDFGRMPEPNFSETNLNLLISDVVKLYPHHSILLDLSPEIPPLQLDEDRIRRVLINLVENAIQADATENPVEISTAKTVDFIELIVRDHGSGIPEKLREKIFEPYFTTKKSGVGLGLAITRKMIEEHGGEIRVASEPGTGTAFTIRLPIQRSNM